MWHFTLLLPLIGVANGWATGTRTTTPNPKLVRDNKKKISKILNEREAKCEDLKPTTHGHDTSQGLQSDVLKAQVAYAHCLFAWTWAKVYHQDWLDSGKTMQPVATGEDPLLSEGDFAEIIWAQRYSSLWNACRPRSKFQPALDSMNANLDRMDADGLADCTLNTDGSIAGCQCYHKPHDKRNFAAIWHTMTKDDKKMILYGNCKDNAARTRSIKSKECIPGAKYLTWVVQQQLKRKGGCDDTCAKGWRWYGILETITAFLETYSTAMHYRVEDLYWINHNFSYMFDRDCPTPQILAAYRPIPFTECVNYKEVAKRQKELESRSKASR